MPKDITASDSETKGKLNYWPVMENEIVDLVLVKKIISSNTLSKYLKQYLSN